MKKPKKKSNSKPLQDEWVIQLIKASEKAVKGYEKYLLDEMNYSDLARIMTDLRDILPMGCKNDNEEDDNNI